MPIHTVDVRVEKQEEHEACWAAVQGKPIPWRHAVLIYQCDTTRRVCWIRDPALGGGKASLADRLVTFDELASGFVYMNKKDFGPKTRALLGMSDGVLTARAFKLVVPAK